MSIVWEKVAQKVDESLLWYVVYNILSIV